VHHVDEDRENNKRNNLVVCEDDAYHFLLHRRMRALKACGHVSWIKCDFCKQYDDPKNMYIRPNGRQGHHRECLREYRKKQGRLQ